MSASVPEPLSQRDDPAVTAAAVILRHWWIAAVLWLIFSVWIGWSIRP